jgi:hypothetical protein
MTGLFEEMSVEQNIQRTELNGAKYSRNEILMKGSSHGTRNPYEEGSI